MSVEKKLATLSNNASIIDAYNNKGSISVLRKELNFKNKEIFQVSSDREISIENIGFDRTGQFRVREIFTRNFVMEITLIRNGADCVLKNNWCPLIIKRLRERVGGENEIVKHGWANNLQTYREINDIDLRNKYSLLSEGNGVSLNLTTANPTIVGYVFLNIQTASMNMNLAQYFPNYQLNSSADFEIEFEAASQILVSGTAPIISKGRIMYEYAAPLNYNNLKPKFDQGEPGQVGFKKGGEELNFHEITSYEYPLSSGSVNRSVLLRSFPTSEIDELTFVFSLDSSNNKFITQKCTNIKLVMSDREIIDAPNDWQEFKQLFRNDIPNKYLVNNNEQNFYCLDLTPLSYKEQEKKGINVVGVVLSEEDILLQFDTPTNAAGTLYIYAVKKVLQIFKNGNMSRVY